MVDEKARSPNLEDVFKHVSKQMRSDFEKIRSLIENRAEKGTELEIILKDFLKEYLPRNLAVTKGFLVDSDEKISKQLDVIIYDAFKTPILYESENIRVIPIECAYSVIEVKSKLGENELNDIFKNMDSVRSLKRKAYYPHGTIKDTYKLYGKKWNYWQTNYCIFAFDSIDLQTLKNYIEKKQKDEKREPENQLDMVCVLNKGVICYEKNDTTAVTPDTETKLSYLQTENSLLYFYSLFSRLFNQMSFAYTCVGNALFANATMTDYAECVNKGTDIWFGLMAFHLVSISALIASAIIALNRKYS